MPTLNAFDMGDTRATVVIVMREREGKAGGGKGFLLAENRSFTLATSNFQIIFYGQRVGDVRVQDDKINTLQARMGTGENNMPMVATVFPIDDGREVEKNQNGTGIGNEGDPAYTLDRLQSPAVVMAFDTFNQTVSDTSQTIKSHSANNENIGTVLIPNEPMAVDIYNATIDKDVTHTLKAANQPMGVPSVLIPGEQMSVSFLHGEISKTSQTLRKGEGSYISVGGVLAKSTVFPTLSATNNPSRSPQSSEVTAQIDAMVKATSTVRRLTPTECERLQGFPDGWTEGQADSHRYKQMGNAVAVPVVEWIINRLTN